MDSKLNNKNISENDKRPILKCYKKLVIVYACCGCTGSVTLHSWITTTDTVFVVINNFEQ